MTTHRTRPRGSRGGTISPWAWTCAGAAALTLAAACRSRNESAAPAAAEVRGPATTAAAPSQAAPPAPAPPGAARAAREITVSAKGRPWVQIIARGETLTVVTEGASLVGRLRDDGKRKYAPAEGGAAVIEVKPRAPNEEASGDMAVGFKLRGPDGKLLWKVKAGPTKIKVAADQGDGPAGGGAFVVSAKHATEAAVVGPDGLSLGRVRTTGTTAGMNDLTAEDAAGAEVFRTSTDLPPALFGALLFQGVPTRERAIILAELAARMTGN